jgi:2-C-methyl-D-erythritol 2,4-cyclodiphosphate synthase
VSIRSGIGWDSHRLERGRRLILGGVHIEHDRGLSGHSDADVLTHAVADALLGALALGDLGQHFPDDDPRYRGISSQVLLGRVLERVKAAGGRVLNVDATVVAETPRLAEWLDPMQKRLAATLQLAPARVSVKVKRAERLGALGRREGIAAMAVALVEVSEDPA